MARPMPAVAQMPAAVVRPFRAVAVDDGQADEADAADHLRRNARRIGAAVAKEEGISDGKIGEGVFGNDHDEGGSAADQAVGADAGFL